MPPIFRSPLLSRLSLRNHQLPSVSLAHLPRSSHHFAFRPVATNTSSTSPIPSPRWRLLFRSSSPTQQTFVLKRGFFTSPISPAIRPTYRQARGSGRRSSPKDPWWGPLRRRIDRLPHQAVLFALIGTNVSVFLLWSYAKALYTDYRDPSLLITLQNNLLCSLRSLSQFRPHTLITSIFSHSDAGHLLVNCAALYFIAGPVLGIVGNSVFLGLYAVSGVVGNLVSLGFEAVLGGKERARHGASGAAMGVLSFVAALNPYATFLIMFVIPCPAWIAVSGFLVWDIYGAFRQRGIVDSAGHVGEYWGLLFFRRFGVGRGGYY